MHEASLALSILEIIDNYEKEHDVAINKAVIEVGAGSGVHLSSLSFCLEELAKQVKRGLSFEFVAKPIVAECKGCGKRVEMDTPSYTCPLCHSLSIEIVDGMEFNIIEFEVSKDEG